MHRSAAGPVDRALRPVARGAVIVCGWWLLAIALLTCVEIVGRKLFGFSLQGIDEIGGYTLAFTSSLALTYALLNRGHTRVDFLFVRFPVWMQAAINVLALVLLAAVALFAAWRGAAVVLESIELQSHSITPLQTALWIPQSAWLAGFALFALTALLQALHAAWLATRDTTRLNTLYGPLTVEEEIEQELADVAPAADLPSSAGPVRTTHTPT